MKQHTERLYFDGYDQLAHSAIGNPRYEFTARTRGGQLMTFTTASSASSAYQCSPRRLRRDDMIRVTYHRTATGSLIADSWDVVAFKNFDGPPWTMVVQLTNMVRVGTKPADPTGDNHG